MIFTFALGLYVLVGIPGRGLESRHYLLPFAPFVAILICWILYKLKDYVSYLVLILSMYFLYPMVLDIWSQRPKVLTITPEITYLKQINKPGINLFVIGNQSSLYRLSKLNSPTRYFYSYPILSNCNSDFTKSALDELNAKPADIICIEKSISHPSCIERLVKGYKLAINGSFFKIYIK